MNKLTDARKRKGLTQKELAELVGCTQTNISHIELGRQVPSRELGKKLAEVLEMDVLDILYPPKN
ncbi:helix-turn-helix transcriptional regulator [Neisseria leonii]|uniref:Helix-turn-helix domain-containing protein n=1 Tax=Neisseria leonii TaxID=2995413 RepID=A0A9X4E478_9NEIS|nr:MULTISPECIES: helix-turn-helix transcriptional regulator [unclassified Neisseria]MDD9324731.1 helix-turn-helix domain-containing protein [Neisseria sp. 3986]MDD9327706.1 helix-turn-helix domain-containing protein [Neisseria sp. 51.81]